MNVYIGGPTSQQVTNYVPQMTADTQDGYTATCSTQLNNTFYAWDSFFVSTQGGTDHCFHSSNIGSGNRGWSQIQLPKGIIVNKIEIGARKNESSTNLRPIGAFSLKGSNDGSTWTEIKAVSGLGNSWSIGSVQSWNITGQTTAYTYLKLEVQAYSSYVAFDYWNIDGVVEEVKVVKNIYIGEYKGGFVPGADTIAYYKFDGNLNDSSTNGHDLSLYTGSATYGTASGGGTYVHLNQNTWANYWTLSGFNYDGNNTISLWINPQTNFGFSGNYCFLDMWESSSYDFLRLYTTMAVGYGFNFTPTRALSVGTWYNVIYTRSGSSAKLYINGTLEKSGAPSFTGRTNQTIRFRLNQIGDTNSSTYANNAYYSDVIFESKEWSAQDVTDYYNQTKSNYGL